MKTWYSMIGAPVAWMLQLILLWLVTSWACPAGAAPRTALIAIGGVAVLLGIGAVLAAAARWRRSGEARFAGMTGETTADYGADWALLVSLAFGIAIVATALPLFMLVPGCEAMR